MEPQEIAIGATLLVILGWLITQWIMGTLKRLKILEDTESEQNVKIAVVEANIEHIRVTLDETSSDVKEILKLNGKRSTG